MWSWLLSLAGLAGTYLVGRKYWWAWVWLSLYNVAWIAYSLVTHQYGFLLGSFVYQGIYLQNALKWRSEKKLD